MLRSDGGLVLCCGRRSGASGTVSDCWPVHDDPAKLPEKDALVILPLGLTRHFLKQIDGT